MRSTPARALRIGIVAAIAAALLASCSSAPKRSTTEWMGVLPGDATIYVSVAVPPSRALIKKTLQEGGPDFKDVVALAERTDRFIATVTLAKGSPARFSAVALGNYPAFFIGLSLGGNKDWKQVNVPDGSYFQWKKAGLELSVPNNGTLMAANGTMPALLRKYKTPVPLPIPPEVIVDMEKSDVVLFMPQLPGGVGPDALAQPAAEQSPETMRLPIREVWIDAVKTPGGYVVGATMNTPTEQKARVLAMLLRIGIVAWMKGQNVPDSTERLHAISVIPEGVQVRVSGIAVSESEVIPLFLSLLKGSPAPTPEEAAN